ncbi:acyltransferase [Fredinandcohnia onubensis]|uniref:acyltransferase n=1 Tax=Fredinandcohnia onubensis TaxID=1571209 RepID=UPI000C0BCDCD|nr:acyltransferase family protein [Fredinandcohnia onubensis]
MNRLLYFDWLRAFATFAVVAIHATAGYVSQLHPDHETTWFIGNFFETISRWAVPAFVMISGALLLKDQREMTSWDFFKKRVGKVLIPFVSWSIFFYLYGYFMGYYPFSLKEGVKLFITNGIIGHFWFFYMIIGLYLITPLLKIFVKHAQKQHIEYFLILWLYASVVTKMTNFFFSMKFSIELYYVTDYVGYFLLGYYLNQFEIKKVWRKVAYTGSIIGFISTFWFTYLYTVNNEDGILSQFWYEYFSPTVLLNIVGLFIFFRYNFKERRLPLVILAISKASLGIYIIHYWLLNNFLWRVFPIVESTFHPIFVIPINILITFILSLIIILILIRIPLIKKLVP